MKTQIQIRTGDFEYIMSEVDVLGHEDAVAEFWKLKNSFKGGEGLTEKEMDNIIQKMMEGVSVEGGTELYSKMTPQQQKECQRIKRALKRINYKLEVVE